MFLDKILRAWNKLEFYADSDVGIIELLGGVSCSSEGAVPGGIVCRRDNIFAKAIKCCLHSGDFANSSIASCLSRIL